jgi:hypothetical protein
MAVKLSVTRLLGIFPMEKISGKFTSEIQENVQIYN